MIITQIINHPPEGGWISAGWILTGGFWVGWIADGWISAGGKCPGGKRRVDFSCQSDFLVIFNPGLSDR